MQGNAALAHTARIAQDKDYLADEISAARPFSCNTLHDCMNSPQGLYLGYAEELNSRGQSKLPALEDFLGETKTCSRRLALYLRIQSYLRM